MKRKLIITILSLTMALGLCTTAFAYGWETDDVGTYYWSNKDNTEWYANGWYRVPFDDSGNAYCYYFDEDGYIVKDAKINGLTVDEYGRYVEDGYPYPQVTKVHIPHDYYDYAIPDSAEGLSNSSLAGTYYEKDSESRHPIYYNVTVVNEDSLILQYFYDTIEGYAYEAPFEVTKTSDNVYASDDSDNFGSEYHFTNDVTMEIYRVDKIVSNGDIRENRYLVESYEKKSE